MAARSDKLFHRRKAKESRALRRKKARRAPYDVVLIVCEGEKTEPNYFKALIDDLHLNTANIKVAKNTAGSAPRSVVAFALKEYKKSGDFDKVYCVFDKDQHPSYAESLEVIRHERERRSGCPIYGITSVPCFEFWVLLHFTYTTKLFDTGHGSICSNVISDLKRHLADYEKGDANVYHSIKGLMPTAITNSKRIVNYCNSTGTDTPSTQIHELVEYLVNLKS